MHNVLISTFRRLLRVTLASDGSLLECEVVAEGRGIYFGLARAARAVFVAERNLDIHRHKMMPRAPENVIRAYLQLPGGSVLPTPIRYSSRSFDDLHQITVDRHALFVTSGKYPFLFRQSLWGGRAQPVNVASVVPDRLQKQNVQGRDAYHFNSVSVDGDSLLALAHNWDSPSFALRLSLSAARSGQAQLIQCYEDIGSCCHDILAVGGAIWSLDSGGSALVKIDRRSGVRQRFALLSSVGNPFPRGLAMLKDMLLVSYGLRSAERSGRMNGSSMLAVFDLKHERFTRHITLGAHGNTCAILSV